MRNPITLVSLALACAYREINGFSTNHLKAAAVCLALLNGSAGAAVEPIDPARSEQTLCPPPDSKPGPPWIYGDGEFEAWQLKRLRGRSGMVCTHVGYPGVYYSPASSIRMRMNVDGLPAALSFRAHGDAEIRVGETTVAQLTDNGNLRTIPFGPVLSGKPGRLEIRLSTADGEPPALLIEDGVCSTGTNKWESSVDGNTWSPVKRIPQTQSGQLPHRVDLPVVELKPISVKDGLYDFGRTILATVVFKSRLDPRLYVGESIPEVLNDNPKHFEQRTDLDRRSDGVWQSRNQLAFRYLRIEGDPPEDVRAEAVFRPVQYRGSFSCSDERINRIWDQAAYTMRGCMNHLMLDGLKRDRLPWMGDQSLNLMVNAYTFCDPEIVAQSFTALGRNGIEASDINNIADYSLWWVIANDWYQLYFDQPEYLHREWPRLRRAMGFLQSRCDAKGYLIPRPNAWLFIDWGVKSPKDQVNVPLQVLWFWALNSGAALAERSGSTDDAHAWRQQALELARRLREEAWNAELHGYVLTLQKPAVLSRHANLLAAVSGLAAEGQKEQIRNHLRDTRLPPVITPFMASLEMIALSRVGAADAILPRIESFWGAQLDLGASTFWEKYDPANPQETHSMYGRSFANSLCHAWASGVCAVLSAEVLGIRPLEDGWKRFAVDPHPGPLTSIHARIPTPHGTIVAKLTLKIHRQDANNTPHFPASGPATGSFNGLHAKAIS